MSMLRSEYSLMGGLSLSTRCTNRRIAGDPPGTDLRNC
jgi:hypothetical protein